MGRTVGFFELFDDLAYMAVIAQAAHRFAEQVSVRGSVEFAMANTSRTGHPEFEYLEILHNRQAAARRLACLPQSSSKLSGGGAGGAECNHVDREAAALTHSISLVPQGLRGE